MLSGLGGSLVSQYFAGRILHHEFAGQLGEATAKSALSSLTRWWHYEASQLGPASSILAIWDVVARRIAEQLGFETAPSTSSNGLRHAPAAFGNARITLIASPWSVSLDSLWREAVRLGIGAETPWVLCTNGHEVRLLDAKRTYSRAHLQFDFARVLENPATFAVFWGTLRAEAFLSRNGDSILLQIIRSSARHGQAVSRSLRYGVIEAVQHLITELNKCGHYDLHRLFDESLTVVYRVLFLMFAESRSLVPNWHPLYRESYTVESLRDRAERGAVHGLWEALQAIARLAHQGCHAGTLVVPAFNGRLFSPSRSPIAETCAVDDETARKALIALSNVCTNPRLRRSPMVHRTARARIDYRDLGVEQLGAVYESVLEFVPAYVGPRRDRIVLQRGGNKRKSTGSFYTPHAITEFLVRRTLHPIVEGISAAQILQLRIVDPSMGSGAFLVSACRYLARAYERALIEENSLRDGEVTEEDRALFRRQIAQRCLFGVDLNPAAVQLARLSLWLATLAADRPLTFLDHHLICGDSLLGASPVDIARQPPGLTARRSATHSMSPLFSEADFEPILAHTVGERRWIAETTDETADIVREKERRLERLRDVKCWKSIADLWCGCWMWPEAGTAPEPRIFASLVEKLSRGRCDLPENVSAALLQRAADIARRLRFFHWMFEFPEAYFDSRGQPHANGGFDAVLGNPPWDMLRAICPEKRFFRSAGIYRHQGTGRINRYQVFAERAIGLTRRGGRVGLVLPSGLATDHTAAALRRQLLSHTNVDTISGFDNRKAIFPIHRSVRFLTLTATVGTPTNRIVCRFGIDDATELETIPDAGDIPGHRSHPITLSPSFIAALGGDRLAIPQLRTIPDVHITERIVRTVPRLADADGWNVRFGRELNATDDRRHFHRDRAGLPILEGKHIEPFRAHIDRAVARISERSASGLLVPAQTFLRHRLAYRDVASATNRLSLIAAILPAGVVSTHSLFCLKTLLSPDNQAFLCAMLNSYVANYLVRQVMTTHLGSATVEALRVPKPSYGVLLEEIAELAHSLTISFSADAHAKLQALAAHCYGLNENEFAHVLSTFPLVAESERVKAMEEFQGRGGKRRV